MTTPISTLVPDSTKISRRDFPADFVVGGASASFQIEGGASEGGRGPSIWDTFSKRKPERIKDGTNGNMGINSYHLYKEDVKILKNLGLDAYRFSVSWPRILPGGKLCAGINQEGIRYYNNLIDELIANDIQPYITLFHWDVPQALEDEYGGFLNPQIVEDFREFAELCFWEFGDRVKNWITLNEPWTFSVYGYAKGEFPPGRGATSNDHAHSPLPKRRWSHVGHHHINSNGNPGTEPYIVTHHQLLAHLAAVETYRNKFQKSQEGQIGMTIGVYWMEPLDPDNESDVKAAKRGLDFMCGWFVEPMTTGDYPETLRKIVGTRLPKFSADQSRRIKASYDFLGVNYYTGNYITSAPQHIGRHFSYDSDAQIIQTPERNGQLIGPQAGSDWLHIYPEGILKLLVYIKKSYYAPAIYITENGVDEVNDTSLTLSQARIDPTRTKYLQDHLLHIRLAMDEGVNVKGYFVWSLMDNWEWTSGFTVRFGIIYVDYNDNYARYPKDSAIWLMNNFHKKFKKSIEESHENDSRKRSRR